MLFLSLLDLATYNREPVYTRYVESYCYDVTTAKIVYSTAFPVLADVPPSFFLPEYGLAYLPQDQGYCGSCYVFSARNVLYSLFKRDFPYYKRLGIAAFDGLATSADSISVEYLLNYSYSTNLHCSGGNFIDVITHAVSMRLRTLELTSHFPYVSFLTAPGALVSLPRLYQPLIPPSSYILPIYWFERDAAARDCPLSIFRITATDRRRGWTEEQAGMIKQAIARGFAVQTEVSTDSGGNNAAGRFQRHKTGILDGYCDGTGANHEVTIVGYGKYKGVDVWALANSWGTAFGVMGFYFVKIGSNAYCHEAQAHIVFSRFWDYDGDAAFHHSSVYTQNQHVYQSVLRGKVRRGYNGLDRDDGFFVKSLRLYSALFLVFLLVPSVFLLYFLVLELFCYKQFYRVNKPPIYFKTRDGELLHINWGEDCVVSVLEGMRNEPKRREGAAELEPELGAREFSEAKSELLCDK